MHTCRDCAGIIQAYLQGQSLVEAGASFGIGSSAVRNILRLHGVAARSPGAPRGMRVPWVEEAITLYQAGRTLALVAFACGVSRERVRQVLAQSGVPRRRGRGGGGVPHLCTPLCDVVRLAPAPFNASGMAKQMGVSVNKIRQAAHIHGVPMRGRGWVPHVCRALCRAVRVGLEAGRTPRGAARDAGLLTKSAEVMIYGRLRSYHPDWPWPAQPDAQRFLAPDSEAF